MRHLPMMQSEVAVLGDVYDFLVATAASYPRSTVPFRKTEKEVPEWLG